MGEAIFVGKYLDVLSSRKNVLVKFIDDKLELPIVGYLSGISVYGKVVVYQIKDFAGTSHHVDCDLDTPMYFLDSEEQSDLGYHLDVSVLYGDCIDSVIDSLHFLLREYLNGAGQVLVERVSGIDEMNCSGTISCCNSVISGFSGAVRTGNVGEGYLVGVPAGGSLLLITDSGLYFGCRADVRSGEVLLPVSGGVLERDLVGESRFLLWSVRGNESLLFFRLKPLFSSSVESVLKFLREYSVNNLNYSKSAIKYSSVPSVVDGFRDIVDADSVLVCLGIDGGTPGGRMWYGDFERKNVYPKKLLEPLYFTRYVTYSGRPVSAVIEEKNRRDSSDIEMLQELGIVVPSGVEFGSWFKSTTGKDYRVLQMKPSGVRLDTFRIREVKSYIGEFLYYELEVKGALLDVGESRDVYSSVVAKATTLGELNQLKNSYIGGPGGFDADCIYGLCFIPGSSWFVCGIESRPEELTIQFKQAYLSAKMSASYNLRTGEMYSDTWFDAEKFKDLIDFISLEYSTLVVSGKLFKVYVLDKDSNMSKDTFLSTFSSLRGCKKFCKSHPGRFFSILEFGNGAVKESYIATKNGKDLDIEPYFVL